MRIGLSHYHQLDALRQVLSELAEISTGEFVGAFEKQLDKVNGWKARIAAIGQVKAGKSSTLNALIGDIGFLPSDVNPWTSVVTSMRINVPGDPECGARFDFFNESDWDRVINGDVRVREAAEENLPGFDAEVLREQTEEMRRNAERRLGRFYHALLGSKHEYDMLSPDLLQRYVCAGPGADAGLERESLGRYAAITRAANLFMRSEEYAVPTVIMDTPGVNDPFLVRDEFTCQSLDQSDIFLMTLSAHQALTEVDLALIRMVAMQGDKDVIIYINRIDELENYPKRVKRVVRDTTKRLAEAIPGAKFTIAFGSAHWAELAINNDADELEMDDVLSDPAFDDFLREHRDEVPECPREKLLLASGITAVKQALSDAIENGSGARFIQRTKMETTAQIAALKAVAQRQRHTLTEQIESYGSGDVDQYRATLEHELDTFEDVDTSLTELLETSDEELDSAVNDAWVVMQQDMDSETSKFIQDQSAMIQDAMMGDAVTDEEMTIELLPLRIAMEDCVAARYRETRNEVDRILEETLTRAMTVAGKVTDGLDARISMEMLPGETVAVTFATSRKMLSLNFVSKRGWAFWKKNKAVDISKTVDALKKVTSAEVFPATNKMIEAFTDTMTERVSAGKDRLNLIKRIVEQTVTDRRERLLDDKSILGSSDSDAARGKTMNRLHNDIEVIDNQLQVIGAKENLLALENLQSAA